MKETIKEIITRFLAATVLVLIAGAAFALETFGFSAIRWLAVVIIAGMIVELLLAIIQQRANGKEQRANNMQLPYLLFAICYLLILVCAAYQVGARPFIILLLLLIISAADIGAWFFGQIFGGDKMWPALSPGKTWSGQIAGIVCGTVAALLYGFVGTAIGGGHFDHGQFMPQLLWIGMSVALLSQYGDLMASSIKRKLGIKDYSKILPGHGGLIDRFDGWIFVLPIVWLVML